MPLGLDFEDTLFLKIIIGCWPDALERSSNVMPFREGHTGLMRRSVARTSCHFGKDTLFLKIIIRCWPDALERSSNVMPFREGHIILEDYHQMLA